MLKNHEQSDFSGFSPQHPMFQDLSSDEIEYLRAKKAKKVGVMKDEINGYLLLEYVGIRPKAYSLKYEKIEFYDEDGKISKKPTNQSKVIVTESEKLKGIKRGAQLKKQFIMNISWTVYKMTLCFIVNSTPSGAMNTKFPRSLKTTLYHICIAYTQ